MEKEEEAGSRDHLKHVLQSSLSYESIITVVAPHSPQSSAIFFCVENQVIKQEESGKKKNYNAVAVSIVRMNIQLIKTDYLCSRIGLNGVVIVGNNGTIFSTSQGQQSTIIHHLAANLPKKQARGNMPSVAFARLRMQSRNDYLNNLTKTILSLYVHKNKPIIDRLFIGTVAPFAKQITDFIDKLKETHQLYAKVLQIQAEKQEGLKQVLQNTKQQRNNSHIVKHQQILLNIPAKEIRDQPIIAIYGRQQASLLISLFNIKDFIHLSDKSISFEAENQHNNRLQMLLDEERVEPSHKTILKFFTDYISNTDKLNKQRIALDIPTP